MSLFLHVIPTDPESRMFLYHLPTHTLAEVFLSKGPGTPAAHLLRIAADGPAPDDAVASMAAWLESSHPGASHHLTAISQKEFPTPLPESIILMSASGTPEILIHYPAIGFTAGIRTDGTKIPPSWKNPSIFTPAQRTHFLQTAADTLMSSLAKFAP